VVEEHTPTTEARLEAIAMDAAAIGSRMNVRLKIGGKVLSAVAIAPGRALLVTAPGEQP
jgi:flagella basal body P-ring formation protein FlgA